MEVKGLAKIVMGYWDCPSCGRTVKGNLRNCPGCNAARGADVKFYTKDVEFLSEEEAAKIGTEPDWLCDYCGTYNNAKNTHCQSCNAVRSNDTKDYFEQNTDKDRVHEKDTSKWECAYCGAQNPQDADHCLSCKAARSEKVKEEEKKPAPKKKLVWPWVLLVIALIVIGAFIIRNKTRNATATVNAISYTSKVYFEELAPREYDTDDRSKIPSDGTFLRTETRTVKVPVPTLKDLGNGAFEEVIEDQDQEVTFYVYTVLDWQEVKKPLETSGTGKIPSYVDLSGDSSKRELRREVTFYVDVMEADGSNKKYYIYESDKDLLNKLEIGGSYQVKVNGSRLMSVE